MEQQPSRWKILLVEDNEDDFIITRSLLSQAMPGRFVLHWSANSAAGLEALQDFPADVLLVDYLLDDGSTGLDFIRAARLRGCRVPAVLLTGMSSYAVDVEAMNAGAADFLEKDQLNPPLLERTIRYAIERQQMLTRLEQANETLEDRVRERTRLLEEGTRRLQESNTALAEANRALADANQALREANELFERIFSSIHLHIAYLDRDFNFIRVNRNYAEADGRTESFFQGKNHFSLYPDAQNEEIFRRVVETGEPHFTFSRPFTYSDHLERGVTYWDWSLQPVKDAQQRVVGLILSLLNVTDQQRSAQALRYQGHLLDNVNDAIVAIDANSRFTSWNHAAEMMFGWRREEALGRRASDLLNPEYVHTTEDDFRFKLLRTGRIESEAYQTCKDGRRILVELKSTVLRDEAGQVTGIVTIHRDITQSRAAEEQVRRSNQRVEAQAELSRVLAEAYLEIPRIMDILACRVTELIGGLCLVTCIGDDGHSLVPVALHHPDPATDRRLGDLLAGLAGPLTAYFTSFTQLSPVLIPLVDQTWIRGQVPADLHSLLDQFAPYSLLYVPLKVNDRLVGSLCLIRDQPGQPYNQEDLVFLEALAGRAALWVANAELYRTGQKELAERRRVESELDEIQRRLIDGTEAERLQLARELHDGPMQDLYSLSLMLHRLSELAPDGESGETTSAVHEGVLRVIDSLRAASLELRPPVLTRFGVIPAIRSHSEQARKAQPGLDIHLEVPTDNLLDSKEEPLTDRLRLTLFRVYQMALTNVIRHAQADRVIIRLYADPDEVFLEIEDNGRGFTPPDRWIELARAGHLGLVGAVERVEALGGQIQVISEPGRGTLIRVALPRGA